MLGKNSYPIEYIKASRERVAAQVSAYKNFTKKANKTGGASLDTAVASFEPVFFNNMVLTLDSYFTHRLRTIEGKDGNPMNEVRVLCQSILENNSVMAADKTIKMKPEKSVLKLEVGDEINVTEADFVRLADAYFNEIEAKFS
jgi:hypothetical protein